MNRLSNEELEEYLKLGGYIKKASFLRPMHMQYSPVNDLFELVTSGHTYNGERGMYAIEKFQSLKDVPYVGVWIKCDERGKELK